MKAIECDSSRSSMAAYEKSDWMKGLKEACTDTHDEKAEEGESEYKRERIFWLIELSVKCHSVCA